MTPIDQITSTLDAIRARADNGPLKVGHDRTDIPNLVAALRVAVENLEILSGWSQEADVCGCYKRSVDALSAIAEKLNLTKQ